MRGEMLDFDLLDMKHKMQQKPQSDEVNKREKFIYSKRRRSAKPVVDSMAAKLEADAVVAAAPKASKTTKGRKPRKRIIKKS